MSDGTIPTEQRQFVYQYKPVHPILRTILLVVGTLSLGIGLVAIVVPGIPTTIFVFIAIFCYARSSERMYTWMMNNKHIGRQYHNIREGKGISLATKLYSLAMAWTMITISVILLDSLALRIFLVVLGLIMLAVMIRLKTYRPELEDAV
jgi:uncharacterized membrane protein YbaN (DUF454 family)